MARTFPLGIVVDQYEIKLDRQPFHMKMFYVMLHEWLLEHEYAPDNSDPNFPETFYYESRTPARVREVWCWWRNKHVPQANPFYRRALNIDMHALGIEDVEVMHNGKKIKMQQGEFWFSVSSILELDWDKRWRNHWLLKHFLTVFWQRFFWRDLYKHKMELYRDGQELAIAVKQFLGIRIPTEAPTRYWPTRGVETA